jgi:fructuronate reductase
MDAEIGPTLAVPTGADLEGYKRSLLERFRNPALKHRTWQIAMDGSQKLPQRLLGTVRDRLAIGAPIQGLMLAVAGWMRYITGVDERGRPIDVRDPLAEHLKQIASEAGPRADRLAPALLAVREIFGDDLPSDARFTSAVTQALHTLYQYGSARAVAGGPF